WNMGLASANGSEKEKPKKVLFLFLGDIDSSYSPSLIGKEAGYETIILHGAYIDPMMKIADIVIPAKSWLENGGTYKLLNGEVKKFVPPLKAEDGVKNARELLSELADAMGLGKIETEDLLKRL
ncbi:MAG: hypothetical protein J7M13_01265, partial [Synergistetes bacterium]|nr:hypothetical protein [Synergistota bacterium]